MIPRSGWCDMGSLVRKNVRSIVRKEVGLMSAAVKLHLYVCTRGHWICPNVFSLK